jgi:hypothetical protein
MRIRLRAWQHLGLPAETRAGALAQLQVLGLIDNTHSTLAGMVSTRLDGCPHVRLSVRGPKKTGDPDFRYVALTNVHVCGFQ